MLSFNFCYRTRYTALCMLYACKKIIFTLFELLACAKAYSTPPPTPNSLKVMYELHYITGLQTLLIRWFLAVNSGLLSLSLHQTKHNYMSLSSYFESSCSFQPVGK